MNKTRLYIFLLFLFLKGAGVNAQRILETEEDPKTGSYHASVEAQGILTTTRKTVPFWMRSNQFGSVPLPGVSGSLIGSVRKDYDTVDNMPTDAISGDYTHLVDWGGGVEVRGDLGQGSRATIIEAYAKLKVSIFELKGGRSKDFVGLMDTSLSSGSFAISGNALGIPKIQISIPGYWTLPFTGQLISVTGNFAHGWIGQQRVVQDGKYIERQTYFHQLSFYGRLGRPDWRLHLSAGFNHQVFWGYRRNDPTYKISDFKTFEYVVMGKTYQGSKIGNHIGSIDLRMDYDFDDFSIGLYRQNFYDEGALAKLANIKDGLNGIVLVNKRVNMGGFFWNRFLLELFYSKDQAGYPNSKRTASGDENYYNNNEYTPGWSYKDMGLGNPFITPQWTTRTGLPNDLPDYFNNNRVVAFYAGMDASLDDYSFLAKVSYSLNYGTFGTSPWGHSRGITFYPPKYGIWKEVKQFSAYLEVNRQLFDGWQVGCVGALDAGGLFYNNGGLIIKLKKSF